MAERKEHWLRVRPGFHSGSILDYVRTFKHLIPALSLSLSIYKDEDYTASFAICKVTVNIRVYICKTPGTDYI